MQTLHPQCADGVHDRPCRLDTGTGEYAIFVGKNLTADGSTLLGGTGDEPSSHWLEIVPRKTHPAGTTIRVGMDSRATCPGELIDIPQVRETARYITMNYSEYEGFPAPLTNGGLNEYGVAARDVWSDSRKELQDMTPKPQHGVNYSDRSRIAVERAHSARDAVAIVGDLIDRYGDATYGGNSHFFADAEEGWVLIDFAQHPDRYRGSKNFISFAIQQGWFDPKAGKPFNVNAVYQTGKGRSPAVQVIEQRLRQATSTGRLSLRQFMDTVRDPLISGDQNGYGQVAALGPGVTRPEMHLLWVAATGSITAPFVPYWVGNERVLPEYGKHRYLSARESEGLVTKDFQIQEASQFAYVTFKRLMYYTCDKPEKFLPEVTEALTAFENQSIAGTGAVERQASTLFAAGEAGLAREALTNYSNQRAMDALHLGEALLGSIEVRHRLLYGYRAPKEGQMSQSEDDREALVGCGKVLPWD